MKNELRHGLEKNNTDTSQSTQAPKKQNPNRPCHWRTGFSSQLSSVCTREDATG